MCAISSRSSASRRSRAASITAPALSRIEFSGSCRSWLAAYAKRSRSALERSSAAARSRSSSSACTRSVMSRIIASVPCQLPSSSVSGAIEICAGKRVPSARSR